MSIKTISKRQLMELLAPIPDTALITFALEPEDIQKAEARLPAGISLIEFGLPGDHSVGEDGSQFLLWAEV